MPDKPKAIFRHCLDVYGAMWEQSETLSVDNMPKGMTIPLESSFRLYSGYLTKLFTDQLSLPNSYYSFVTKELLRMDCIRNLQRGGGGSKSLWLLLKEPTQDDFDNMPELDIKMTKRQAAELQFKRDTNERLTRIELQLGIVSGPS